MREPITGVGGIATPCNCKLRHNPPPPHSTVTDTDTETDTQAPFGVAPPHTPEAQLQTASHRPARTPAGWMAPRVGRLAVAGQQGFPLSLPQRGALVVLEIKPPAHAAPCRYCCALLLLPAAAAAPCCSALLLLPAPAVPCCHLPRQWTAAPGACGHAVWG